MDLDDSACTSASTTCCSSPQAASLLLKALQKSKRRSLRDAEDAGEEITPRTPFAAVVAAGRRTSSCGRSTGNVSPGAEFGQAAERSEQRKFSRGGSGLLATLARCAAADEGWVSKSRGHSRSTDENVLSSPGSPGLGPLKQSQGHWDLDLVVEPQPQRAIARSESESGLLARRRKKAPDLDPFPLSTKRPPSKPQETACIRRLDQGEKIFDLYYWDEVLQEQGCGGKVVVCTPKVSGDLTSPLLRSSRSSGSSPSSGRSPGIGWRREKASTPGSGAETTLPGRGTHVLKMKSKADLTKAGAEAQFRKAHLKMLNLPHHMGILPLHEVLEDENFYYVVMERANGGSLLSSLVEEYSDGLMPEKAVKRLMKEILSAIEHIHKQGILHRDIKVDNLVVQVYDDATSPGGKIRTVKLIDFDIADPDWIPASPGKKQKGWVGTMKNSAPETFRGIFSQRSDLYSVGTVLFLLMTGRSPYDDQIFDSSDEIALDVLADRLRDSRIDWSLGCWTKHSACRDFCKSLLAYDPELRPASAQEAAKHQWFTNRQRSN